MPTRTPVGLGGTDPESAALAVLQALDAGVRVALGFECPIMVPVSSVDEANGWMTLGRARKGETVDGRSRPWSASAGGTALATGLVQMAWVLERLGAGRRDLACTTSPKAWLDGSIDLLIWEAFVSGAGKPTPEAISQHAADAAAAADTFADRLVSGSLDNSDVTCDPPTTPFNLAAAAASYAGLSIEPSELRSQLYVCRTRPAAKEAGAVLSTP